MKCTICGRPIVRAELAEAAATAWKTHVWLDEDGESGADGGLPTHHEHRPENEES